MKRHAMGHVGAGARTPRLSVQCNVVCKGVGAAESGWFIAACTAEAVRSASHERQACLGNSPPSQLEGRVGHHYTYISRAKSPQNVH